VSSGPGFDNTTVQTAADTLNHSVPAHHRSAILSNEYCDSISFCCGGTTIDGLTLFALCIGIAFAIQWVAFVPAYLRRTESFFDLTGSITYIAVMTAAVSLSPFDDTRSYLLLALVAIWALRLGTYLFRRIRSAGFDRRFAEIKQSLPRFLAVWTLQGLWVSVSLAPALAAVTSAARKEIGALAVCGTVVWAIGFTIEVVADRQKSRFRADTRNEGRYICTGLWAWSRHPNYFGEIVLWIGVTLIAIPNFRGWQWITALSPLFTILLLTRISGIPPLERRADEKWGGQDDYETYKRDTPALLPRPPR